jgi:hypothetical protein
MRLERAWVFGIKNKQTYPQACRNYPQEGGQYAVSDINITFRTLVLTRYSLLHTDLLMTT